MHHEFAAIQAAAAVSSDPLTALLHRLNARQQSAVTAPLRHTLVLAGAGSGKTRVLVTRVAWLLQECHIQPWQILAMTFTKKAADEMRTRLQGMLPNGLSDPRAGAQGESVPLSRAVQIGTIHSVCLRLITRHHNACGMTARPTVLTVDDQTALVRRLVDESPMLSNERGIDRTTPAGIVKKINRWKDAGLDSASARAKAVSELSQGEDLPVEVLVFEAYEAYCRARDLVDFADLQLMAIRLLSTHSDIATHYQRRFRAILVDEFQDTNLMQYELLRLLCPPPTGASSAAWRSHLFAVGDDDQSIYGFRGAEPRNMTDFCDEYQPRVIKLEQNYRSTQKIVAVANHVITRNADRIGKSMWSDNSTGPRVAVSIYPTSDDEANAVAQKIAAARSRGQKLSTMAVLYRTNAMSRVIETACRRLHLPVQIVKGTGFFDRKEIRDAVAWLRACADPNDDVALERCMKNPPRGIGTKTIATLRESAQRQGTSLWVAMRRTPARSLSKSVHRFIELIGSLSTAARSMTVAALLREIYDRSDLTRSFEEDTEDADRVANLYELITFAESFEQAASSAPALLSEPADDASEHAEGIVTFLNEIAVETSSARETSEDGCVQLLTIHSAKGLEWDTVYSIGWESGILPHVNANKDEHIAEERRLAYVACTRARRELHLTLCRSRSLMGQRFNAPPSMFLQDIPPGLLDASEEHLWEIRQADPASRTKQRDARDMVRASRFPSQGSDAVAPADDAADVMAEEAAADVVMADIGAGHIRARLRSLPPFTSVTRRDPVDASPESPPQPLAAATAAAAPGDLLDMFVRGPA